MLQTTSLGPKHAHSVSSAIISTHGKAQDILLEVQMPLPHFHGPLSPNLILLTQTSECDNYSLRATETVTLVNASRSTPNASVKPSLIFAQN